MIELLGWIAIGVIGILLGDNQIRQKLNIVENFDDVWLSGKVQDIIIENFDDVWI